MKTNYHQVEKCCITCKFYRARDEAEYTQFFCNQDNFVDRFNFDWWKNGYLTSDETNTLYLEEENHKIYLDGVCDEWEKIEDIYD